MQPTSRPSEQQSQATARRSRRRLGAILVMAGAALGAITSFGYLGGFLAPDSDTRDLPIVIVNLDRGATTGASRVRLGDDVVAQLEEPNATLGDKIRWTEVPSRRRAQRLLRSDDAYAAVVIPEDFSSGLIDIASGRERSAVPVEVLSNPASGSYSGAYSQAVAAGAVDEASRQASKRLVEVLSGAGTTLAPAQAAVVGRPIEATITVVHPIGSRGGRGLAPFYLSVVVVVATVFATSVLNIGVDVSMGTERLSVMGRRVRLPAIAVAAGDGRGLRGKLRLVVPIAGATTVAAWAVALGPLSMSATNPIGLLAFLLVAGVAAASVTLGLYAAFDLAGSVLAALFLVIYGVPSAGGVYPVESMPAFFRFVHGWIPLRYVTDGTRALVYGGGAPGAVVRAVAVLILYAALGLAATLFVARRWSDEAASA